jgi:hypothetical protein
MGSPLWQEEGLVFLSRCHICWTIMLLYDQVWSGNLHLTVTRTVILGSGPHDHTFLSHDCDSLQSGLVWSGLGWADLVICCGPSPGQSFLIPGPAEAMTKFFCLTTLESFDLIWCGRLLLALTSTVILDSGPSRTHNLIFLACNSELGESLWLLTHWSVCRLGKLLLVFASTVILGSGPHRTGPIIILFCLTILTALV